MRSEPKFLARTLIAPFGGCGYDPRPGTLLMDTGPSTCAAARRARERIRFVRVGGSGCVRCGRGSRHRRGQPAADAAGDRPRPPPRPPPDPGPAQRRRRLRLRHHGRHLRGRPGLRRHRRLGELRRDPRDRRPAKRARWARSTGWPTASRIRTGRRRRRRRWPTPRPWSTWRGRRWRTGEDPTQETSAALDHLYAVYTAARLGRGRQPRSSMPNRWISSTRSRSPAASGSWPATAVCPTIMWLVLIGGGVLVVGFAFLFGVESAYSQAAILSGLTLTISLLLFVVADAQHPFRGSVRGAPGGDGVGAAAVRPRRPLPPPPRRRDTTGAPASLEPGCRDAPG